MQQSSHQTKTEDFLSMDSARYVVLAYLQQLSGDGIKVLVHCLLGVIDEGPPDVNHGVPDTGIGVILIPVKLGHQSSNVGLQTLPSKLGNGCKSAGRPCISSCRVHSAHSSGFQFGGALRKTSNTHGQRILRFDCSLAYMCDGHAAVVMLL